MNCKAHSFLFFICLLFCTATHAQQKKDSAHYYYEKITKPINAQGLLDGYHYFDKERKRGIVDKNGRDVLYALQMMSQSQMKLGANYDAEATIVEAIKILDSIKKTDTLDLSSTRKRLYNSLGIIYNMLEKYPEAISEYTKALSMAENAADSSFFSNNLGVVYKDMGDHLKAHDLFKTAYSLIENSQDSTAIAITLDNWGLAETRLDKPEGLLKMHKALKLRKRIQDVQRFSTSYNHLSAYYKDIGNKSLAITYADSAYQAANAYTVEYSQDALSHKLLLTEGPEVRTFITRSDSIKKLNLINENKWAGAKYSQEVLRAEKDQALLQSIEEKAKNNTYLFIVILVILLSIFLIVILTIRSRKKRAAQVYLTETRISKKVHDEVSNDVYRVMTHIQSQKAFYPEILDELDNIYKRTRDISRENGLLDVETDFGALLKDLFLSYQSDSLNLITQKSETINWQAIPKAKKLTIYRVLQELITNTNKHGEASLILIAFEQKGKKVHISYTDNGKGGALLGKNGLQNVENRISALKGRITFDSKPNSGFKAQIHI